MAGRMISELNDAGTLQSTDLIPLARGTTTLKLPGAAFSNLPVKATGSITERMLTNRFADVTNAADYGLASGASAADNLTALKAAIAAAPAGGVIIIPPTTTFYSVDTTGGLTNAVNVSKNVEIVLQGSLKANSGLTTPAENPPYIFNVTASDVTFSGSGSLIGNGVFDTVNSGTEPTPKFGGLIYVEANANNFTANGITIDSPNKCGIFLYSCKNAKIVNCTFVGGPTSYGDSNTLYFGVRSYLGSGHIISDNHCIDNSGGGRFITFVSINGTTNCVMDSNILNSTWAWGFYIKGDKNVISNNHYQAPVAGNKSDVYRIQGSNNVLSGNYSYGAMGGAQIHAGSGNQIVGNKFFYCLQSGILVTDYYTPTYTSGLNGTVIIGNTVNGGVTENVTKTDGIKIHSNYGNTNKVVVTNNYVEDFTAQGNNTEGLIRFIAGSTFTIEQCTIANNTLVNGTNGIYLEKTNRSEVSNNYVYGYANYSMVESTAGYNSWVNNRAKNTSAYLAAAHIGISGLATTSDARGNRYGDTNLNGTCAPQATQASTIITHGGVAPNAKIVFSPSDAASSNLTQIKGVPFGGVSGTDFTIGFNQGTGVTAQTFYYQIIQ